MLKKTILVVEDEKDLLKILRYNLEKEGYCVLLAETGEKGFELAKSKKPDLIILDLMLPQMDGFEVCRFLKYEYATKNIPILILTAKNSETDQVVGLELGAADYMTKPFSVSVLLARIKNILKERRSAREEAPLLRAGSLTLDREKFLCAVRGKPVELTKIEFKILSALMERPGNVLTREDLIGLVWGSGAFVTPAAMNMHVMKLREKLGSHGHLVQTVRGVGFRLAELFTKN